MQCRRNITLHISDCGEVQYLTVVLELLPFVNFTSLDRYYNGYWYTVKPVLSDHSNIDKTKILMVA